jgi:hypothetical protein
MERIKYLNITKKQPSRDYDPTAAGEAKLDHHRIESNNRIFNRKESSVQTVMAKIKCESLTWIVAGAKGVAALTARM